MGENFRDSSGLLSLRMTEKRTLRMTEKRKFRMTIKECHVERSETSKRIFFGTFVPQNDRAFYGHVERSETSQRRFFAVAQNDKLLPVMPPNEMRIRHLLCCYEKTEDPLALPCGKAG